MSLARRVKLTLPEHFGVLVRVWNDCLSGFFQTKYRIFRKSWNSPFYTLPSKPEGIGSTRDHFHDQLTVTLD
jgi:hypothetical protein